MIDARQVIQNGIRLDGAVTRMEPFGLEHLNDRAYMTWLHDHDVIRTLYLRDYLAAPVKFEEVAEYVKCLMASETDMFLGLHDSDGRFVGTLKAGHVDWDASIADIGIMIGDRASWGKGLATDAIYTLCRFLFEELKLRRLTAGAMGINTAMIHIFEKLGFKLEGRFRQQDHIDGSYCDHVYLGCFASELRAPSE